MVALVRVAPNLRAILASHVEFQFMDRRRLRPPHDVEGDSLVGIATEASDFEKSVTSIERVAQSRRGLGRSL